MTHLSCRPQTFFTVSHYPFDFVQHLGSLRLWCCSIFHQSTLPLIPRELDSASLCVRTADPRSDSPPASRRWWPQPCWWLFCSRWFTEEEAAAASLPRWLAASRGLGMLAGRGISVSWPLGKVCQDLCLFPKDRTVDAPAPRFLILMPSRSRQSWFVMWLQGWCLG